MGNRTVRIHTPHITLGDFLKWAGAVQTGGEAKALIQEGRVRVNGDVEPRRGRKLRPGDRVELLGAGRWDIAGAGE